MEFPPALPAPHLGVLPKSPVHATDQKLRDAAVKLEASFLSEMLKAAGFGAPRDGFGGGIGEEQFGSFLRDEQAQAMAESGGIGLAEALFNALKERADEFA